MNLRNHTHHKTHTQRLCVALVATLMLSAAVSEVEAVTSTTATIQCASTYDGTLQGTISSSKVGTGAAVVPASTNPNLRLGDGCCVGGSGAACCASATAYDAMVSCALPAPPVGNVLGSAVLELVVSSVVGDNPLTWQAWSRSGPSRVVVDFVRCVGRLSPVAGWAGSTGPLFPRCLDVSCGGRPCTCRCHDARPRSTRHPH